MLLGGEDFAHPSCSLYYCICLLIYCNLFHLLLCIIEVLLQLIAYYVLMFRLLLLHLFLFDCDFFYYYCSCYCSCLLLPILLFFFSLLLLLLLLILPLLLLLIAIFGCQRRGRIGIYSCHPPYLRED